MSSISEEISRKKLVGNIKRRGFTLIELIIVISIIAILAAIAVPRFSGIQKDAKAKSDVASAKVIADATYALIAKDDKIKANYVDAIAVGTEITDYIQVIPEVKAVTGSKFFVKIDPSDNVFVSVRKDADVAGVNYVLYPTQSGVYPPVPAQ